MIKHASLAAAAGVLAAGPALAGGLSPAPAEPVVAPVVTVTPDTDWSGFYAGAQLGYGQLDGDAGDSGFDDAALDADGALGGIHAGYLRDFGSFVLGGEADLNAANIEADGTDALNVDQLHRLRVKAGYDAGRALLYGTAGAAYAEADLGGESFSDTGYTLGLGVDYAVSERVTVGGEVNYQKFDDFDDTGLDLDGPSAQARVSFRF